MKYFERIDKYLKNQMSDTERQAFEAELVRNEELASEYEIQQVEEQLLDVYARDQIQKQLQQIKEKKAAPSPTSAKRRVLITSLSIAAGLLLLLTLGRDWLLPSPAAKRSQMVLALYEEYPPTFGPLTRNGTEETASDSSKLMTQILSDPATSSEQLAQAIAYFQGQVSENPIANYYLGHGLFKAARYQEAVRAFRALQDTSSPYQADAAFFECLALVQADSIEAANQRIDELLSVQDQPYVEPLRELKSGLE